MKVTCLQYPSYESDESEASKRQKSPVNVDLAITIDRTGSSEQFRKGIPSMLDIVFKTLSQMSVNLPAESKPTAISTPEKKEGTLSSRPLSKRRKND